MYLRKGDRVKKLIEFPGGVMKGTRQYGTVLELKFNRNDDVIGAVVEWDNGKVEHCDWRKISRMCENLFAVDRALEAAHKQVFQNTTQTNDTAE